MKNEFEQLSNDEIELLLMAPVIISVLAASGASDINEWEKADAIKFAQLKNFNARPHLIPYYKGVDKTFEKNFEMIVKKYAPFNKTNRNLLEREIYAINDIIEKLDIEFAVELQESLREYAAHIQEAYKGLVVNFLFPITGLTE